MARADTRELLLSLALLAAMANGFTPSSSAMARKLHTRITYAAHVSKHMRIDIKRNEQTPAKNAGNCQNPKDPKNPKNPKNAQDPKNPKNAQDPKNPKNFKNAQDPKNPKNAQDAHNYKNDAFPKCMKHTDQKTRINGKRNCMCYGCPFKTPAYDFLSFPDLRDSV